MEHDSSQWCQHPVVSRPRRRVLKNGKITFWRQCTTCGTAIAPQASKAIAMRWAKGKPAEFDEQLIRRYWAQKRADNKLVREHEKEEWRTWYADYLKSNQWSELRWHVMERCGHLCEGCRIAPATEVHHLTYDHVGNEFLFELVGLCGECHARFHRAADERASRVLTYYDALLDA